MLKKDIAKSLRDEIIKALRGPIREEIREYLRDSFTQLATDYESFINPVSDLETSKINTWVSFFLESFDTDYDASLASLLQTDSLISIDISFIDEEKLGFDSDSISSPIHWVYFYINGQRNNSFFISANLLESFLDTRALPSGNPAVRLIHYALENKIGEFGDGFLITAYEFNAPNDEFEGVRWSDLFSEDEVTPPSAPYEHENYLETVSTNVGLIMSNKIDQILNRGT